MSSVAYLTSDQGCEFKLQLNLTTFVEIDHEIISMGILTLPLIQEVRLSVTDERMSTILVNRLED